MVKTPNKPNNFAPGLKRGHYDAVAAGRDSGLLHNPGNPQNAPQISSVLDRPEGLPKALRPFETMIRQAVARTLPTRPQEWQKRGGPRDPKQTYDEDPNARIILAANNFLLALETNQAEPGNPRARRVAEESLEILRCWSNQLAHIVDLQRQLESAVNEFRKAAPLRITE